MKGICLLSIIIVLSLYLLVKYCVNYGLKTAPKEIVEYKRLDFITLEADNDFLKNYRTRLKYNDYGVTVQVQRKKTNEQINPD